MPVLIAYEKDISSLVSLMDSAYRGEILNKAGHLKPIFSLVTREPMKQQ